MDNNLVAEKKTMAELALFGLTETVIDPPSLSLLTEAQRILFTESDELKKIALLLGMDWRTLQGNVFRYLTSFFGQNIH